MAIGKVTKNSKKSFLGGGMGSLIPLGPLPKKRSENKEQSSPSRNLNAEIKQIFTEAKMQMSDSPSEQTDEER